jgi:membrane-bound lytic murein transglycosylase D
LTKNAAMKPPRAIYLALFAFVLSALAACATFRPSRSNPAGTKVTLPAAPAIQPGQPPATPPRKASEEGSAALAPAQYADLFDRIRDGFGLPISDEPAIERQLDWYASNPDYLQRAFGRADLYLYYIVTQLEARHMPLELSLLPVIESAYQPFAYSRARASGLWQFVDGTAKEYGLKANWWYDGRRDVVASTNAALDFLQALHRQFGDWLLAVAAYNCGPAAVQRAIQINEARHRPTDFWHLRLPRETEAYVPKLLAMTALVADPAKYGLDFSPIPNQPYFTQVPTGGQINLQVAARIAGITTHDIYQLNPAFHRWASDPTGPFYLLLPVDAASVFEQNVADLTPDQRMGVEHYTVRRGDSIYSIARRFKTNVAILRRINAMAGKRLSVGADIEVPATRYVLPAKVRLAAARVDRYARLSGNVQIQIVRRGDSLWRIARRYGITVRTLARMNGISPHGILRPGERLRLYARAPVAEHGHLRFEVVRRGDTLWRIARRHGMSVRRLAALNGLSHNEVLHPGERLRLYTRARYLSHGGLARGDRASTHQVIYRVRPGDSLWRIAHRFQVSVEEIRTWNAISLHTPIVAGQKLTIRVLDDGG